MNFIWLVNLIKFKWGISKKPQFKSKHDDMTSKITWNKYYSLVDVVMTQQKPKMPKHIALEKSKVLGIKKLQREMPGWLGHIHVVPKTARSQAAAAIIE